MDKKNYAISDTFDQYGKLTKNKLQLQSMI